ncbi:MAG TPA: polyprenyl synthetase family protein [Candidatus Krumholzibacteriaceae bacterium]|jgi:octaprenyl-diphosphate synthase|nr:polyprenyl synthetase family protein [Candidatus Krumholzibacteriaceae bacterium]
MNLIIKTKEIYLPATHFCVITSAKETDLQTRSTLTSYTYGSLQSYLLETKKLIESSLENLLEKMPEAKLRPLLEYALLTKGKRLRPILVILGAQSIGGRPEKVMQLALSYELLHTATLVHDDIIDQDVTRRGAKTLCSQWSANGAILAGDALIALAINLAAEYGPQIVKILSNVGLELCEGEYVDATLSLTQATEQEYFAKIEKKSASLFRGAACCGALVAEGNALEVEALARFGEYFGMAYQVNDDLEDLQNRNQVSQDLKNGNVTLPLLFLYQHGDKTSRKLLTDNFGNRSITKVAAEKLRIELDKIGAFSHCRSKVAEYSEQAHASLKDVRNSVFKDYLAQFFDHVNKSEGQSN